MGFNFDNIKVGDKIDLGQFEKKKKKRPEQYLSDLKKKLFNLSQEINTEFSEFLNSDGSIKLLGKDVESDEVLITEQEKAFAQGEDMEIWKEKREKKASNIAEIALTIAFHHLLKDDFVVARASSYDDYNNGVDQLIIDKKTGAVVCGFDEVLGNIGDDGGRKKEKKMRNKMQHGGARVKYGATIKEGRLIRKELFHIPAFYIAISKEELDTLLLAIENDNLDKEGGDILDKLIVSLENQFKDFSSLSLQPQLKDNLNNFKESLEKIKQYL